MAQPQSREDFKDFILRKIGAPVIQINVADEQVEIGRASCRERV